MAALTGPPPYKVARMVSPQAIKDDGSWTVTEVDTLGFDYAVILVHLGATDIAMAALMIKDGDVSGSHAEIAATDCSDADQDDIDGTALGLPSATDDNKFIAFHLDLTKRKRYLSATVTAGDGTTGIYLTMICLLFKAAKGPDTSAEYGCDFVVRV